MKRRSVPILWMSVALGVALAMAIAVLAVFGTDARATGAALRLTARWSFLLFWLAYAGSALAVMFGPTLAPLARRGREFGLAFAAAHLVHIGLVVWLYHISAHAPLSQALFIFFAVGIFWTYLLAALSFGGLVQALGPTLWRVVRVVGMNYILLAFARDFVLAVLHPGETRQGLGWFLAYVPFAAMCAAAPVLVLAAAARRRWRVWHLAT